MIHWKVPLFSPDFGPAELEAVQRPVKDGWLTMGERVAEVEAVLRKLIGVPHAFAVNNCTAALHMAMVACGIGPGDEVLCPTLTFVATANAIRYTGATPVFCESVGEQNLNIDPKDVERKITSRTRAMMVVHFAGYPADMPALKAIADRHGFLIVEDCAHALVSRLQGRPCGAWGTCGCFSFFSNKNITCGEGGAIVTTDDRIAERLTRLRSHGMTTSTLDRHRGRAYSYDVTDLGYNYRLDEIRSSLLLAQLQRLDGLLDSRARLVTRYVRQLDASAVTVPHFDWKRLSTAGDTVGYHIMPVLLPDASKRQGVMEHLREHRIQSSIHYPPIHRFSAFEEMGESSFRRTEEFAARELTLPLYPSMTDEQVDYVCKHLRDAVAAS